MAGIFAIGIPMLGITLFLARKFTPIKVNYRLNGNLFIPWLISMGIFTGATLKTISDYQAHSTASYSNTYDFNPEETLTLDFDKKGYEDYMNIFQLGHLKFYDNKAFSEYVSTHLVPSKDKALVLETEIESRGSSRKVADKYVENIKVDYSYENNKVTMAQLFEIGKSKFRGQEVYHTLHIPVGTKIQWDHRPQSFRWNTFADEVTWNDRYHNKLWEMTEEGLIPFKK